MRIRTLLFGALAAALAVPACSGGGGGGGGGLGCSDLQTGGTLTTGTYVGSCWDQVLDECAVLSTRNGDEFAVTVTGTSLQIGLGQGMIIASNFTLSQSVQIDFNDDPYGFGAVDCVVDAAQGLVGVSKVGDFADVIETQDVTEVSGTECDLAEDGISDLAGENISLPCHSEEEFRMELQQ